MSYRILLVHPGASMSVGDVYLGFEYGLKAHGVDVIPYALHGRLKASHDYMMRLWRKAKGTLNKPTYADLLYHASSGTLERAVRHEVDLVLFVAGLYVHPDCLILLRRAGLKTGILFTESPYATDAEVRYAQYIDICWTMERTSIPSFVPVCPHVFYLPHAWHPLKHLPQIPAPADTPRHDVVFVGTAWPERVAWFKAVDWTGLDLGVYGVEWETRGLRHKTWVHEEVVTNDRTAHLYRAAKIGLNLHRTLIGFGGSQHISTGAAESLNRRDGRGPSGAVGALPGCGNSRFTDSTHLAYT